MCRIRRNQCALWIVAATAVLIFATQQAAADATFTYQGQLKRSGQLVNAQCDFQFRLWDASQGGLQVGPTLIYDGVGGNPGPIAATRGLFTAVLDFGPGVFDGSPRYLEVWVRCPSGAGDYSPLEPRQPITAAPQATHADLAADVRVPLSLSLDDAGQTTLTVENAAADGVALDVRGDLAVGAGAPFRVDALGGLSAQGAVFADDVSLGGVLSVGSDPNFPGFYVLPSDGSFSAGAAGGAPQFYLNAADRAVVSDVDFYVGGSKERFSVDSASGDTFVRRNVNVGLDSNSEFRITLAGDSGDLRMQGDLTTQGSLSVERDSLLGIDALSNTVRVAARLEVAPNSFDDPVAYINGTDGNAFLHGSLELDGALFDSANDSPGAAGQFLSSTTTGTEWRDLIVGPLDMKRFAITDIGTNGSTFSADGGLNVKGGEFTVGPDREFLVNGADGSISLTDAAQQLVFTVQSATGNTFVRGSLEAASDANLTRFLVEAGTGNLQIGPDVLNGASKFAVAADSGALLIGPDVDNRKFHVDGIDGSLFIGPNILSDRKFVVLGDTGDTTVRGDLEVDGAYVDSGDSHGSAGQLLSSTGVGTQWIDQRAFVDGIIVPDENDPKFQVGPSGVTDIQAPLTVTITGGGIPGPAQQAIQGLADSGTGVFGRVTGNNSIGVYGTVMGASSVGVSGVATAAGSDGVSGQAGPGGSGVIGLSTGADGVGVEASVTDGRSALRADAFGGIGVEATARAAFPAVKARVLEAEDGSVAVDALVTDGVAVVAQGGDKAIEASNDSITRETIGATNNGGGPVILFNSPSGRVGDMVGAQDGDVPLLLVQNNGSGHAIKVAGGDGIHVENAYFDSGNLPGDAGQLLSSTGTGTAWVDRRNFADGIVVPDEVNTTFLVTTDGTTDIKSTLTVEPDFSGAPGPAQNAVTARVNAGTAVYADANGASTGLFVEAEQGRAIIANCNAADTAMQLLNGSGNLILWQAPGGRIGEMHCISDQTGLTVTNSGTGATLDVKSGDLIVADESLHVKKRFHDSSDSAGTDMQLLTSTGSGTMWRDLITGDLDLKSFAITNVGTSGSGFTGEGALIVNSDLFAGPQAGPPVVQVDSANGQFIVGANKLIVEAATGNINVNNGAFTVDAVSGDVATQRNAIVHRDLAVTGDARVSGRYFDSAGLPGNEGQLLSSTETGTLWVDPSGQGGDGEFNNISIGGTASFGPDAQNPTAQINGATGEAILAGAVEPRGGIRDAASSLGAPGQVLSSTGDGVLWIDCDCNGGGGGSCITCNDDDASVDGTLAASDGFLLTDSNSGDPLTAFNGTNATFNVPLNAQGNFNYVKNVVTDQVQISNDSPVSPVLDVTATADFAPLVRIFNFLGAALALQVQGNVAITGSLSKGGGSFKIDHPLDPENKYLLHSFVESPDMMNVYNGNVVTDAEGVAVVVLPAWFEALNRDFRYQLTVIGTFAQAIVGQEIADGQFTVLTDRPGVKVSWQVTGIRHDRWAEANRIPVELPKSGDERGKYLHPEVWNAAPEQGVHYDRTERQPSDREPRVRP